MPGGDRSGPRGGGSRTGRGLGYCTGYSTPGSMNPVGGNYMGFGRGMGRGGGRGNRNMFYATGQYGWQRGMAAAPPPVQPIYPDVPNEIQIEDLKLQAEYLENTLKEILNRITNLEKKPGDE